MVAEFLFILCKESGKYLKSLLMHDKTDIHFYRWLVDLELLGNSYNHTYSCADILCPYVCLINQFLLVQYIEYITSKSKMYGFSICITQRMLCGKFVCPVILEKKMKNFIGWSCLSIRRNDS